MLHRTQFPEKIPNPPGSGSFHFLWCCVLQSKTPEPWEARGDLLPKVPGPTEVSSRAKCSLTFSVNAIFEKQANVSSKTQNYVGVCVQRSPQTHWEHIPLGSRVGFGCVWLHSTFSPSQSCEHFSFSLAVLHTTFPAEGKLYPTWPRCSPLRHPCRRQLEKSRRRQVNEVSVLSKTEKLLLPELLIFSRPINTHTRAGERLIFFLSKRDAELGLASVRVCVIRKKSSSHLECPR